MKTSIFLVIILVFFTGRLMAQQTTSNPKSNNEIYVPVLTKEQKAEKIKQERIKQAEIKKTEVIKTENTVNTKESSSVINSDTTKTSQPSNAAFQMQTHKQAIIKTEIEKVKIDEIQKSENN